MKKKLGLIFSSLALVVVMIATLCACSTYGSVKKAFEKKGWSEVESLKSVQEDLVKAAFGEDHESTMKVHALGKDGSIANYVVILEFNSTKEMQEELKNSKTLQGLAEDLQKSDAVSGTCVLLFYTPLGGGNDIFKSTK